MDTLPTKIAHRIFSLLPRDSLFSCLFVNQIWHDCSQTCLYEKVHWPSSDKLGALLTALTQTHEVHCGLGKYVKQLDITINQCDLQALTLSKFLLLCPNIEEVNILPPDAAEDSDQHIPLEVAISLTSCTKLRTLKCNGKEAEL